MTVTVAHSRPGGRSAKIQAAIHQAVRELLARMPQEQLTIPVIAVEAGVTPSTIYRRWGSLSGLLADVAIENLRPDMPPQDTGNYRHDLYIWLEAYFEEMSSPLGRKMLQDIVASQHQAPVQCAELVRQRLDMIKQRAKQRQEKTLDSQCIIDHVVAPMIYRILFSDQPLELSYFTVLTEKLLSFLDEGTG